MDKLKELSKLTKELSVLYVEDSKSLLKQMDQYLSKLFKNVYKASDGHDGLNKYKKHIPDIVLTDLKIPNMDGFEMIKVLKKINPDVKIIIISSLIDTDTLLKAIHIGVSDFIPKPIDKELLSNILLKVSIELNKKDHQIDKVSIEKANNLLSKLAIIGKSNSKVELINHYKGVPIIHEATIISKNDTTVVVHAQHIQTLAIAYEKFTMIENEFLENTIEASLIMIDKHTREITLGNLKESYDSAKSRKQVRLAPDKYFKAVLHSKHKKIDATVLDLSIKSISLLIDKNNLELREQDEVNINLGFKLHHKGGTLIFEDLTRVSTHAAIFKIINKGDKIELVLLYELNKANNELLGKYIIEREIELIKEFKTLNLDKL